MNISENPFDKDMEHMHNENSAQRNKLDDDDFEKKDTDDNIEASDMSNTMIKNTKMINLTINHQIELSGTDLNLI